jgi:hypothetical protein
MNVGLCLKVVLSCVGRGLCDELITRPKESYRASHKIRETSKRRTLPDPVWSAMGEKTAKYGIWSCVASRFAFTANQT